jgi:hypothetical protein
MARPANVDSSPSLLPVTVPVDSFSGGAGLVANPFILPSVTAQFADAGAPQSVFYFIDVTTAGTLGFDVPGAGNTVYAALYDNAAQQLDSTFGTWGTTQRAVGRYILRIASYTGSYPKTSIITKLGTAVIDQSSGPKWAQVAQKGVDAASLETVRASATTPLWYTQKYGEANGGSNLLANRMELAYFDITFPCRITGMGLFIDTLNALALLNGLIYEDYQGWPGDRLFTSADVLPDAAGRKFADLTSTPFLIPVPRRLWVGWHNKGSANCGAMKLASSVNPPGITPQLDTAWGSVTPPTGVAVSGAPAASHRSSPLSGSVNTQTVRTWLRLAAL